MNLLRVHAGQIDQGQVRTKMEDRLLADPDLGLYVVADGMGGRLGGGLAAEVVVQVLPALVQQRLSPLADWNSSQAEENLRTSLVDLSARLQAEASGDVKLNGMGSTVVALAIRGRHALIGHLGDSRAYLLRDGRLEQLTQDHTLLQLLLDAGEVRPEQAAGHPARNLLTRFVGMDGAALPDVRRLELRPCDRLLLCSDGLYGMVPDGRIAALLADAGEPAARCRALVEAANAAGGRDNIAVLLVETSSASG